MVNISLISGFLGSGKTTLIKKLLEEKYFGSSPLLIENDYGTIKIDDDLMAESGVQIKEISQGCICCSIIGSFALSLKQIIEEQKPDHIIIEPSGVGKLSEIISQIEDMDIEYNLHLVVTLADAKRFENNDRYVNEYFWDQILNADGLVLSKTAGMSDTQLLAILGKVRSMDKNLQVVNLPQDAQFAPAMEQLAKADPMRRAMAKKKHNPLQKDTAAPALKKQTVSFKNISW